MSFFDSQHLFFELFSYLCYHRTMTPRELFSRFASVHQKNPGEKACLWFKLKVIWIPFATLLFVDSNKFSDRAEKNAQ